MIFKIFLFVSTVAILVAFSSSSFAVGEVCSRLERAATAPRTPGPDEDIPGYVGVRGGVFPSPVRNQGDAQDCWAQTLGVLMTNVFRLNSINALDVSEHVKRQMIQNPREFEAHVSPEHFLFWHIYHQIKTHLGTFRKLAADLDVKNPTEEQQARQKYVEEAYGLIHKKTKSYQASKYYQPDVGNQENVALEIADLYGAVPVSAYDVVLSEERLEAWLEKAIPEFIGKDVLNDKSLDRYEQDPAADGINDALFNDLAHYFHRVFEVTPLRPGTSFEYHDQAFTPQTFMRDHLGFIPKANVAFVATPKTHELALQAMAESLMAGKAVPIGITLFDDEKIDLLRKYQDDGTFRADWMPTDHEPEVEGGHEIIAVNFLFIPAEPNRKLYQPGDKITAIIIQNSWGTNVGRDVNGKKSDSSTSRGYYVLDVDYLEKTLHTKDKGDAYDFVLPPPFAAKYLKLLKLEK